jgi:hypothetical protein
MYRIVGDGRRGVEDAVAAGPQNVVVEQVGVAQRQPLRRIGERPQVRVLQARNFFLPVTPVPSTDGRSDQRTPGRR